MKKKNLSFISGLLVFTLFLSPFSGVTVFAEESVDNENVTSDTYHDNTREDVYDDENITDDVYEEESTRDDVYGDSDEEESTRDDVYGDDSDGEGNVPGDVYGDDSDGEGNVPGDVYGDDTNEDESATDEPSVAETVYITNDDIVQSSGDDIKVNSNGHVRVFSWDIEQFMIAEKKSLVISEETVSISYPIGLFKSGAIVDFIHEKVATNNYPALNGIKTVGDFYDFNLLIDDEYQGDLSSPVSLTFDIDPSEVDDVNNLRLVFVDEDGNIEYIEGTYDADNNQFIAEVTHFSVYGVVEVESSEEEEKTQDSTNSEVASSGSNDGNGTASGNELPDTFTGFTNLAVMGAILLLAGMSLLFIRKRQTA
ncbi:hypothetical protein [Gracilibacillus massiliensis]|uniref:hypothetical protein n=1 Tax=Gracilibacillus massiliensis TaxID=1564956 RepID=UPI00071CEDC8|nr:hypothetical protein [Gracilibacillus massiliensis]